MRERFLIDATAVAQNMDGLGLYANWLTKRLACVFSEAMDVLVAAAPSALNGAMWSDIRGVHLVAAPAERLSGSTYSVEYLEAWDRFVRTVAPDVYLSAAFVNTTVPCPRAVVVHDLAPLAIPDRIAERKVTRFAELIVRSVRLADLVLAPSMEMAQAIRAQFGIQNVRALYPDISQLRGRLAGPASLERYEFVVIGVKCPRKHLQLALDGLRVLRTTHQFRVALVGNLREQDVPVYQLIADAGLERCVDVLGYVSDERLRNLLASARALVFPSAYEGFGIPPVEAMALRTSIVCLPLPVLQELLGAYPIYVEDDPVSFAGGALRALRTRPPTDPEPQLRVLQGRHDEQFAALCRWIERAAKGGR